MSNRRKLRGSDWAPLSRQIRTITNGREDQLRAEIEHVAPGFLDQAGAAAADGRRHYEGFIRAARDSDGDRAHEADASQIPQQLTDQITGLYLRVMAEVATGERQHCKHISLQAPRPAIACVHASWIYCYGCTGRITRPRLTDREEHTCDLCGTYRPGQTMHGMYPQVGPVMLIVGICPRCRTQLIGTP